MTAASTTDQDQDLKHVLNLLLIANGALSTFIFLNSIFVLNDAGGLNEFLSSATYMTYIFAAIIMLNRNPSAFSIGMLLGSSVVLAVLAFMNTLYWVVASSNIDDHPVAAGFAAAFNFIFFGVEASFIVLLYRSKHTMIETYSAYDYIPDTHAAAAVLSCSHCEGDDTFSYQSTAAAPTADI